MVERRSSSTPPMRKATPGEWMLAFPESLPRGFRRKHGRAEKIFNIVSVATLVLFAVGWSWSIARARAAGDGSVITVRPAAENRAGRLGLYYIGNWPAARKGKPGVSYDPPSGFIEVTPQDQNTQLSEHFKLRDFLPHDQANVWPKYIVVDMKMVDKDELVLQDLKEHGINPDGVRVMSGFRTPQYNAGGGDPRGRAALSRHMYGDANDIFIDNDGNGQMDDLNHDGRVNIADAKVIQDAVNRVERAHPSLIGGCGIYSGTSAHGPFTHIYTRGYPARWI